MNIVLRRKLVVLAAGTALVAQAAGGSAVPLGALPAASAWKHYPQRPKAPIGAPNVLLVLTDDVGFGASSAFGGPIPTPVLDALARNGLRYNAFHTRAMCSPTRAALLTGRNHHAVGTGAISNVSMDERGYTSAIPKSAATIGRVLQDAGYDTGWFGKNHNTPEWELGPMGAFERWPNGLGFEYFYSFNAGMTGQRTPTLIENRNAVQPPNTPDYYLDRDLADRMIHWFGVQRAVGGERPFFAYLAPGTMHSPQQAPPEWIARFRGKFDKRLGQGARRDLRAAEEDGDHPYQLGSDAAPAGDAGLGQPLAGGSAALRADDGDRCSATCLLGLSVRAPD